MFAGVSCGFPPAHHPLRPQLPSTLFQRCTPYYTYGETNYRAVVCQYIMQLDRWSGSFTWDCRMTTVPQERSHPGYLECTWTSRRNLVCAKKAPFWKTELTLLSRLTGWDVKVVIPSSQKSWIVSANLTTSAQLNSHQISLGESLPD